MQTDEADRFISLPERGLVSSDEAEAYVGEQALDAALKRRGVMDELLASIGFHAPGRGKQHLDQVMSELDEGTLDESGGVLISSEATLRPGEVYFLGLNPGGEEGQDYSAFNRFPTVYESLAMSRLGVCGWDQDWSREKATFEPGQAPLQRRFKHIARRLGLSYSEIFATNLVFARSRRFKALESVAEQIEGCLPIHRRMLAIVQPKYLWVMGNTDNAGSALRLHNDVTWTHDEDHSNWSIGHGTADFCGLTLELCHTPHLSLWDATAPEKEGLLQFAFGGRLK